MKKEKPQPTVQQEPRVNINIRIPEPLRHHWNIEAKRQRTTIQDAVVDCLTKRFGKPKP